jgi:hypothetical protein
MSIFMEFYPFRDIFLFCDKDTAKLTSSTCKSIDFILFIPIITVFFEISIHFIIQLREKHPKKITYSLTE